MTDAASRRLHGRIGGLTAWARHDAATMVGPAHAGFRARFERQVIEAATARGEVLAAREVAIRADRARRAYMLALAAKSATARKKAATARGATTKAAASGRTAATTPEV